MSTVSRQTENTERSTCHVCLDKKKELDITKRIILKVTMTARHRNADVKNVCVNARYVREI